MPLYSNILQAHHEGDDGAKGPTKALQQTPSASLKLLQNHLLSKKRGKQAPSHLNKKIATDKSILQGSLPQRSEFDWDPEDEYDPMTPSSYELLQLEYVKTEERRLAARRSGHKIDLSILDALDRLDENDDTPETKNRSSRGTAIAPPPKLHSTNSDPVQGLPEQPKTVQTSQTPGDKSDGMSAAAKIMAKMGYKSGQGLGKDKQGMSEPLEVEASGTTICRVAHKQRTPPPVAADATRILLLQNMVGPGEVDDDLEAETKEECTKYGEVIKCLIYEIPNKRVPDDEAVRIFVEFKDVASTRKAISDLNGRYFGGRVVKATSYEESKFNKYELAP